MIFIKICKGNGERQSNRIKRIRNKNRERYIRNLYIGNTWNYKFSACYEGDGMVCRSMGVSFLR